MNQLQKPPNTNYNPPPPPQYYSPSPVNRIPTIGNYIAVQLLAMIPLIGFILMIVWAVGGNNVPLWKSNYARAFFIMVAISIGITVLIYVVIGIFFASLFSGLFGSSYYW